jgi:hypothetical protein
MREHRHQVDTSVGVSGPHDFAVRAGRIRLVRRRVHRIPLPTFVTTAKRPSFQARDGRRNARDLPDIATENACGRLARRANQFAWPNDRQLHCQLHSNELAAAQHDHKFRLKALVFAFRLRNTRFGRGS